MPSGPVFYDVHMVSKKYKYFIYCQKPTQKPLSDFMNPAEESYKGADLNAQIMHRIDG